METKFPIKVVQFGEGNFLRAFADYAFQRLNIELNFNAGIAMVQPRKGGTIHRFNSQDGLYTLFTKGIKKGKEIQEIELITNVVKCINPFEEYQDFLDLAKEEQLEFIISNTTEAGIEFIASDTPDMKPPVAFPARVTILLHERFKHFNGDTAKGLTIIPCELINFNGDTLKGIILEYCDLWHLDPSFKTWLNYACSFHNTLVDRIVPGYPKNDIQEYNNQLEYQDDLIVTAEPFFLWVIEGGEVLRNKLPFHKTNLNVKIVDDLQPFRTLKVRILNGAHTAMVPFSLLFGNETVKETVDGGFTGKFVDSIISEISSTLPFDKNEVVAYSDDVMDRFRNPFIRHALADIALNSISKFKVRILPSITEYYNENKQLPPNLTFAFACLIQFYKGTWNGTNLPLNDMPEIVEEFKNAWHLVDLELVTNKILANKEFWEKDLTQINGLSQAIVYALTEIQNNGIEKGYINFNEQFKSK